MSTVQIPLVVLCLGVLYFPQRVSTLNTKQDHERTQNILITDNSHQGPNPEDLVFPMPLWLISSKPVLPQLGFRFL